MPQVSVIIPLMRPHRIAPVVASIQESTEDYEIIVVATGECADAARDLPVILLEDDGGTWPVRINRGYLATTAPSFVTGADDLDFRPGWFEAVQQTMSTLPDGGGVIALNDLYNSNGVHFVIQREYIESFGGYKDAPGIVVFPGFKHQYSDDAIRLTAQNRGRFAYCNEAIVEHLHPGAGKSEMDATYALGESTGAYDQIVFRDNSELWV
jgi:hypothetical protein